MTQTIPNSSNPTRLGLALQDISYPIPAGVNSINLRIEAITTWWNEIVSFDNIRVTSGEAAPVEPEPAVPGGIVGFSTQGGNLVIEYTGTLKAADTVTGPYSDVSGVSSPATITPEGPAMFHIAQ